MDTLLKARTNLLYAQFYAQWRDRIILRLVLFSLLWVAATTALVLFLNHHEPSVQPATAESYATQQVTHQQIADRYRDPELTYFFGK